MTSPTPDLEVWNSKLRLQRQHSLVPHHFLWIQTPRNLSQPSYLQTMSGVRLGHNWHGKGRVRLVKVRSCLLNMPLDAMTARFIGEILLKRLYYR